MSDFNNWNTPYKKPKTGHHRAPPGLRGKEIGLFYRDLSMRNKLLGKEKKEFSITFTMPPSVAMTVKKNIRSIIKTAQEENITLPQLKRNYDFKGVKEKVRTEAINPQQSNDKFSKIFDEIKQQYSKSPGPIIKSESNDDIHGSLGSAESICETSNVQDKKNSIDLIKTESIENNTIENIEIDSTNLANEKTNSEYTNSDLSTKTDKEIHEPSSQSDHKQAANINICNPSTSAAVDFIAPFSGNQFESLNRQLALRCESSYKYGYEDIITGTFDEKLEEHLAKGVEINTRDSQIISLNSYFYDEYQNMVERMKYKKMLEFRKILPTYKKAKEILDIISKNQVVVISGETGCGKSTQVPQIILDDALRNFRGANVKILVTEPRRIAASSLAMRIAEERDEKLGNSVGYAVRLERVTERACGSIQYCTTGILLADLEINQSLGNFSHIILDEVHERDCHIDLAMFMLKKVLKKRKDLKVILMSATIDSDSLASYFDNCVKLHIEGLAYPVKDVYLEEVLQITRFRLPESSHEKNRALLKHKKYNKGKRLKSMDAQDLRKAQEYIDEVGDWLKSKQNVLDVNTIKTLRNPQVEELNYDLIVELLMHICKGEPGAVLIFLPGHSDISSLMNLLTPKFPSSRYQIYPLHSKLPTLEQHLIFERPQNNKRKIIIATNIAETSITIDDIVYVIDSGRHKVTGLNVERNYETLDVQFISKANLRQRRGRAGRCQPGICYHLVTSFRAEKLAERTLPELQRSNLLEPVLTIKRLRLGLAGEALKNVPSPPADSSIQWAVKHLQRCGALNEEEKLTPLGWHMARLPVHPAAGKLLLLGSLFGCLDRAASVAAVWGFKDPFLLVIGKEREIDDVKRDFTLGEPSDHIAVSEALISWEKCPRRSRREYCYNNFLSHNTMELLSDMKKQFGGNLQSMGFLPSGDVRSSWENRNSNNLSLFKAIVAAALYPNIAQVRWIGLNSNRPRPNIRIIARTPEEGKVALHPSSVMYGGNRSKLHMSSGLSLNRPGANWLVYWMKRESTNLFIFDVTLIYSLPLLFFGDFILSKNPEAPEECILEVASIKVRVKNETADLLYDLRTLLDLVLASKVMSSSDNSIRASKFEEQVLNTVIELMTAEDEQAEYVGADLTDSDYSESDFDNDSLFNKY